MVISIIKVRIYNNKKPKNSQVWDFVRNFNTHTQVKPLKPEKGRVKMLREIRRGSWDIALLQSLPICLARLNDTYFLVSSLQRGHAPCATDGMCATIVLLHVGSHRHYKSPAGKSVADKKWRAKVRICASSSLDWGERFCSRLKQLGASRHKTKR